jgi:hypothetical protein
MASTSETQFPRTTDVPVQSAKYWAKEKDRYLRQLLIRDIEAVTKRPLFVYFSQLNQQISETDADDLAEILAAIPEKEADFFIQTPGGAVDATEKIISILRQKFDNYRVIVPSWAKSAGTVISLSANSIVLGINSELGPIDPQWQTNGMTIPCELLSKDEALPQHIREMAGMAVERMRHLATIILERGIMKGKPSDEISDLVSKLSNYMSHGAVIDYYEAKSLGLSVEYIEPTNDLWKRIWLLYCIYDYDSKIKGLGKIFEGYRYSISRPA